MDAITFVSICYVGSCVEIQPKVALRYDTKKESAEQVAKEFFDDYISERAEISTMPEYYYYKIYERESKDKFVEMYSSLLGY